MTTQSQTMVRPGIGAEFPIVQGSAPLVVVPPAGGALDVSVVNPDATPVPVKIMSGGGGSSSAAKKRKVVKVGLSDNKTKTGVSGAVDINKPAGFHLVGVYLVSDELSAFSFSASNPSAVASMHVAPVFFMRNAGATEKVKQRLRFKDRSGEERGGGFRAYDGAFDGVGVESSIIPEFIESGDISSVSGVLTLEVTAGVSLPADGDYFISVVANVVFEED